MMKMLKKLKTLIILMTLFFSTSAFPKTDYIKKPNEHPCYKNIIEQEDLSQHTTNECLNLVNEFESRNIFNDDYLRALNMLASIALHTADYGIANQTYEKVIGYIEGHKAIDPSLKILSISSYINFLVLHKDKQFAKKMTLKYLSEFKNINLPNTAMVFFSIYQLEKNLAEIYVGEVDTNKHEMYEAKKILDKHINISIPKLEETWKNQNVSDTVIYITRQRTYSLYGDLLRRLGSVEEGLVYKKRSLDLTIKFMTPKQQAWSFKDVGEYYDYWLKDYETAIDYYKQAINIFEKDPILIKEYYYLLTLDNIANSYWFLEKYKEAYPYSRKATEISLDRISNVVSTKETLSFSEELDKAKERFETHVNVIKFLLGTSEDISQTHIDSLLTESIYIGQLLPQLNTAKALTYLDVDNNDQKIKIKNLNQKKIILDEKLNKLITLRDELRTKKNLNYKKINEINENINNTDLEIDSVKVELKKLNSRINQFNIQPVYLHEIASVLEDDEALIIFHEPYKEFNRKDTSKSVLLNGWLITNDYYSFMHFQRYQKDKKFFSYDDVFNLLRHLNFTNKEYLESPYPTELSYKLYKSIFSDLDTHPMTNKIKKLIIINDGILYKIPYWALTTKQSPLNYKFKNLPWFANKYTLTISPSVQSFVNLRNSENNNLNKNQPNYLDFVGIGNPNGLKERESVFTKLFQSFNFNDLFINYTDLKRGVNQNAIKEMPALPGTEKELKTIAGEFSNNNNKLLLRDEANEKNVKNLDLTNTKYVVFSSHAIVAGEMRGIDQPGIILTPPDNVTDNNDGLLTANEISSLEMNAELVVLSACNTGSGNTNSMEGLTGLAKSFFIAGNRELLVSNWRVTDKYAAELTTMMFKYLNKNNELTKAEALQLSIKNLINKDLHPIFWAPFMLVGDGL